MQTRRDILRASMGMAAALALDSLPASAEGVDIAQKYVGDNWPNYPRFGRIKAGDSLAKRVRLWLSDVEVTHLATEADDDPSYPCCTVFEWEGFPGPLTHDAVMSRRADKIRCGKYLYGASFPLIKLHGPVRFAWKEGHEPKPGEILVNRRTLVPGYNGLMQPLVVHDGR